MRRLLSISLTLLLWLGPLASLLPGSDESRLPFCCRRRGAHHCAMDAAPGESSSLAFKALSRCQQFPAALAVSTTPAVGLGASPAGLAGQFVSKCAPSDSRDDARPGQIQTPPGRGPPHAAAA